MKELFDPNDINNMMSEMWYTFGFPGWICYHRYYHDIGDPYYRRILQMKDVIREQIASTESWVRE
ncbi:MAG: hypothetical protein WD512_17620 [Candidatus Paceibacterota bacterium]